MQKSIIFMGTPSYAVRILQELVDENFSLKAVFTQSDKKVGRKQILTPSAVKSFVLQNLPQIPIFTPNSLDDQMKIIEEFKADFIVVAAYGKILPKSILDLVPCINIHASLLPKYRGASPIQSAILNAEENSGVCSMLMDEGLDTGAILQSVKCDIKGKNASELFELFANLGAKLCVDTLLNFAELKPMIQDETQASLCRKIKKNDGLVDPKTQSAKQIYQRFLALYIWPGIFLENALKFIDLDWVDDDEHLRAGEILALEKQSFLLACKKGTLRIKRIQESGKKILDARTFLNGKRLKNGDFLC